VYYCNNVVYNNIPTFNNMCTPFWKVIKHHLVAMVHSEVVPELDLKHLAATPVQYFSQLSDSDSEELDQVVPETPPFGEDEATQELDQVLDQSSNITKDYSKGSIVFVSTEQASPPASPPPLDSARVRAQKQKLVQQLQNALKQNQELREANIKAYTEMQHDEEAYWGKDLRRKYDLAMQAIDANHSTDWEEQPEEETSQVYDGAAHQHLSAKKKAEAKAKARVKKRGGFLLRASQGTGEDCDWRYDRAIFPIRKKAKGSCACGRMCVIGENGKKVLKSYSTWCEHKKYTNEN
jgi:hypothetical protein